MKMKMLLTLLVAAGTCGFSQVKAGTSDSTVAYVYVSRPTHIDGFAVAKSGKLTPVPGSPFAHIRVFHLSTNKKFLIGTGSDGQHLYVFRIEANGSLTPASTTDLSSYEGPGCTVDFDDAAMDYAGVTYYVPRSCGDGDSWQVFHIEANGNLHFIGNTTPQNGIGILRFLGNDKYAYETGFYGCATAESDETFTAAYKRESDGFLTFLGNDYVPMPPQAGATNYFCTNGESAGDPTDHLAVPVQNYGDDEGPIDRIDIATYTADAQGKLTTQSTAFNMAETSQLLLADAASISPTGKLLALGGTGFEVFHFNGGGQATRFTGLLQPNSLFGEFGWDKDNHLFALTYYGLFVYNATPSRVEEAPGSPYSIDEASSVIVVSLH